MLVVGMFRVAQLRGFLVDVLEQGSCVILPGPSTCRALLATCAWSCDLGGSLCCVLCPCFAYRIPLGLLVLRSWWIPSLCLCLCFVYRIPSGCWGAPLSSLLVDPFFPDPLGAAELDLAYVYVSASQNRFIDSGLRFRSSTFSAAWLCLPDPFECGCSSGPALLPVPLSLLHPFGVGCSVAPAPLVDPFARLLLIVKRKPSIYCNLLLSGSWHPQREALLITPGDLSTQSCLLSALILPTLMIGHSLVIRLCYCIDLS